MRTLLLAVLVSPGALAQAPTDPPPIIQLVRKPGTDAVNIRPYATARAAVDVLGMNAVTGLPETWLLESHQSFASIEDLDQSLTAVAPVRTAGDPFDPMRDDVLAPARTMIAIYGPDWSYRPDQAIRLFPKARYFQISVYRIRPGGRGDFGELVRLRRLTSGAVNLDRPELAYRVISGAPDGTYLFLAPLTSLRTMDDGVAQIPVYAEGLAAAKAKDGPKIAADSEISREYLLFRINPRISYVSDAFAESDQEFWHGKK
jgi:hypothetical protein